MAMIYRTYFLNSFIKRYYSYINARKHLRLFKNDFNDFESLSCKTECRFPIEWEDRIPCLNDKTECTDFDRHYIYHTAWAARILSLLKPEIHTDISSSLYFSSIVSAFLPVNFYDYRPPLLSLSNLKVGSCDICKMVFEDNSIESLSCMHVIEHIGLGRYGDPLDPDGDIKAAKEIARVLAPKGSLLIAVPVGQSRICFNAHRIYSYQQVLDLFPEFELQQFALITDQSIDGGLIINASSSMVSKQQYACGCFHMKHI